MAENQDAVKDEDVNVRFDQPPPPPKINTTEKSNGGEDKNQDEEKNKEDLVAAAKKEWDDLNKKFNFINYCVVRTGTLDMVLTIFVQSGMLTFPILCCNVMGRNSNAALHFVFVFSLTFLFVLLLQLCKGDLFTTWNYVKDDYRRESVKIKVTGKDGKIVKKYKRRGYNNGFFVPELCITRIFNTDSHGAFGLLAASCMEMFCYFWQVNQHLEVPLWVYYVFVVLEVTIGYYWFQTATEHRRYRKGSHLPNNIMRWLKQSILLQLMLIIVFITFLIGFGVSEMGFGGPTVNWNFVAVVIILAVIIAVRTMYIHFVFLHMPEIFKQAEMDMNDDEAVWAWRLFEKFRERFAPHPRRMPA